MLCGYLKQMCRSITVKDLIAILETCKNKDAVVQMSGMTNFFIHFDQDAKFLDITKSPRTNDYGLSGVNKQCDKCLRFDHDLKICGCDGSNCLNAFTMVDTDLLDKVRSKINDDSESSNSGASTEQDSTNNHINYENHKDNIMQTKGYDLTNMSINGTALEIKEPKNEIKASIPTEEIQDAIDSAIIKTLKKMINGIEKEDK